MSAYIQKYAHNISTKIRLVSQQMRDSHWTGMCVTRQILQFISRVLDISLISLVWKLGRLINSDISQGQTDICCCYLPKLPPLTQTGLVPKRSIFLPKVTVSRLILAPKVQNHAQSKICDFWHFGWKISLETGNFGAKPVWVKAGNSGK